MWSRCRMPAPRARPTSSCPTRSDPWSRPAASSRRCRRRGRARRAVVTAGPTVNLSCNLGTLASGATASVTIVVRPSIATTGNRANTATITSLDVGDPNRGNNSASVTSVVTAVADVTVTKSATPSPVQAGTPLTYVVTARNNGPSTASAVVATDTLPANAAFVSFSGVTGTGRILLDAGGRDAGWHGGVPVAEHHRGHAADGDVRRAAADRRRQRRRTTSPSQRRRWSRTSANNTATITTPVNNAAVDILVNKVDSVDPVALGLSTRYLIVVANAGPSYATNVVLIDVFPLGGVPSATFSYQGNLTRFPSAREAASSRRSARRQGRSPARSPGSPPGSRRSSPTTCAPRPSPQAFRAPRSTRRTSRPTNRKRCPPTTSRYTRRRRGARPTLASSRAVRQVSRPACRSPGRSASPTTGRTPAARPC